MRLASRVLRLTAAVLPAIALLTVGLGTAQASPAAPAPPVVWQITGVSKSYLTHGSWHDCAQVKPTPGFKKSYTCTFTGSVSNTYSGTVGVSAGYVSASVGFSVTYGTSISGGTTYTPNNQKDRGEVQWTSQYLTKKVFEKATINGRTVHNTGHASHWNQPITRYVPAEKIVLVSETKGKWGHKHWKCKKRCP
jgi:hypothetical protein